MNKIYFTISKRSELSPEMIETMFQIMCDHYENTFYENFIHDLNQKNYVISLHQADTHQLVGFSTQQFFMLPYKGTERGVLFSGDTIIHHDYWGSFELPLAFGNLMIDLIHQHPNNELYWLLISKGARTYRFLPVFFREYYPAVHVETPESIKEWMDFLGEYKFGKQYKKYKGILEAIPGGQFLKNNYQPDEKREQEHIKFFNEKNPGYTHGDELLCITKLTIENLTPLIKRLLHV